jgi:hypothetical protein
MVKLGRRYLTEFLVPSPSTAVTIDQGDLVVETE